jgi:hypothetical protein
LKCPLEVAPDDLSDIPDEALRAARQNAMRNAARIERELKRRGAFFAKIGAPADMRSPAVVLVKGSDNED